MGDEPLRILHVITRFLSAGTERNLLAHMRWQRERGHDVQLAMGRDSSPGPELDELPVHQLPHLIRSPHALHDVRAFRELRRLVEGAAFDVVHTHQSKAGILGRLAARGRAGLVHTVHMESFGPSFGWPRSPLYVRAERYCGGFTDVMVCVGSELCERYLAAGIGSRDDYLVVRSPIELAAFARQRALTAEQRAALREHAGIAADRPALVAVGALEPRKRHRLLLASLAPLLARGEAALLIAGSGTERAALERQCQAEGIAGAVRFLGQVDDVPALLGGADLLVHTASAEGVPQVVVQALAAGVPVVATEVAGLREIPDAPVRIVDRDGRELLRTVEAALAGPAPAPVALQALDSWEPGEVERQLATLQRRIEAAVERRRASART